jgi:hypothetical protein
MKRKLKNIKRYLWDVFLFSGIGCFSYFLLVYYADIPSQYQDRLMTFQAFAAVVVLFNGVGLSVKYINERLMMYYQYFLKNHRMLSVGLITAAIILFISNYLLLISTKLLIVHHQPYIDVFYAESYSVEQYHNGCKGLKSHQPILILGGNVGIIYQKEIGEASYSGE